MTALRRTTASSPAWSACPTTDRAAGDALVTDLTNRCAPVVLGFLGSRRLPNELTYWFIYDDIVNALDRNVLCVVAIDQDRGTVVGSLRGIGAGRHPHRLRHSPPASTIPATTSTGGGGGPKSGSPSADCTKSTAIRRAAPHRPPGTVRERI